MNFKICGLKDPENIKQVAALKPDYMGFIFYPSSKRFVGEDFIMPQFPSEIKKVGVFVNATATYIIDKIDQYKLDLIQLHGDEKPDFCEVFNHFIPVIKAFGIHEQFDWTELSNYEQKCSYFLFDTKTDQYGGSGKQFEWNLLKNYKGICPFFLSGGIGLEEIEKLKIEIPIAIGMKNFVVDVNSKFEIEPGIKDVKKIEKVILMKHEN